MSNGRSGAICGVTLAALLLLTSVLAFSAEPAAAQTAPPQAPSCGWHGPLNGGGNVSGSPAGLAVAVTIGEPSWQQDCFNFPGSGGSSSGLSFPAYEVFPIIIHASPGTTVRLEAGQATPSAQQISEGILNTSIWTWFSPNPMVTDSGGIARSNLTLVGAVMPFVPNDIANVSLPITAMESGGASATAGLPIEFEGGNSGGTDVIQSPGPITFGNGVEGQVGQPSDPIFSVVYSPPGSATSAAPLQVSLKVLGTYDNGKVGPMPADVQVSFPQSSFELTPYSVFYFPIQENNSLKPSNTTALASYTFAVQEKVGNGTYVEPLAVSVSLLQIFMGTPGSAVGAIPQEGTRLGLYDYLIWPGAPILVALVCVAVLAVVLARRQKAQSGEDAQALVREATEPSPASTALPRWSFTGRTGSRR